MKSISIRFALASASVALFILAITGGIDYLFLKKELLLDATQKAHLIEKNSRYQIEALLSKAQESSSRLKNIVEESTFDVDTIKNSLRKSLEAENSFFGMALAFNPRVMNRKPFSPYYYKKEHKILYRDLASKEYDYLTKDWYTTPMKLRKSLWSKPYFDKGGGNILMATYSNPIFYKEKVAAILTIDLSLQKMQKMVSTIKILKSGYAFIFSKEHKILAHPDTSLLMQTYPKKLFKYNVMIKEKHNWIYYAHIVNTDLTLVIVFPTNELFASLHYMSIISIVLALVGAFLLIVTMILISHRVSGPLRELTTVTAEISKGNFNRKITLPKSKDEIYRLSFAVNTMQEALIKYIKDLKSATIKQQKIESELDIASAIQMSMLPKELAQNKNISLHALLHPAKAVGGDFYDFFYIDDEHLCFVIADVSGKGVPAAMFMAVTMSYLRAYSSVGLSALELIVKLNNTIASNNDANMFVTLFLAILDLKSGELNYVNAGHNEPYLMNDNEEYKRIKTAGNPVIGAFEGLHYKDEKIFLDVNSKLFLYTDGVTEAFSKEDEAFGDKRLSDLLWASKTKSAEETLATIENSLKIFAQGCEQSDDITMLLLEFRPSIVD